MGKGKPLFEILNEQKLEREAQQLNLRRRGVKQPEPVTEAPQQPAPATQAPQPVAAPAPAPAPEAPAYTPAETAPKPEVRTQTPAAQSVDEPHTEPRPGVVGWLTEPVSWRLPRGAVGAGIAALVAVAATSFVAGQRSGEQVIVEEQQEYAAASASLVEYQQQPNPALIPTTVGGVDPHNLNTSMGDGLPEDEDPRIENLNYFRLIVVPSSAGEEIYRIVDFLRDNGVDAAVVPINNGRSLKVMALPGFERPRSDPRAVELKEQLLRLGRKWVNEHDGSTDWRDLFAEKYVRGIN